MWTLIIIFLYPHVGTSSVAEFYDKAHCLEAKHQIDAMTTDVQTHAVMVKTTCVAQGD